MEDKNALLYSLNGKTIAYRSIYTQITGKLTAGILLSQVVYWSGIKRGGEFYKTNEEFAIETALSLDEVKSAKKILISLNLISVEHKSLPRRTYYKLNEDVLISFLTSEWNIHQPVGGISTNLMEEFTPTTSENTTENTTKTTTLTSSGGSRKDLVTEKDIDSVHREILAHYNSLFRPVRPSKDVSWVKNANYWLGIYSLDDIKLAITNWYKYPHWSRNGKSKCELSFLFRTKNKNGECNYIEEMLSMDLKVKSIAEIKFDEEFENAI